jgi:hypothetical protein
MTMAAFNVMTAWCSEIFRVRDSAGPRDRGVECPEQIRVRVDARQLRGFAERVEKGRDLRAAK